MSSEKHIPPCKAMNLIAEIAVAETTEGTTKNGKPIVKGKCPDCGTTICRIGAVK